MATTKKTVAKKAPAKKAVSKTVKSTAPADLKKPAGTPAEGLDVTPATADPAPKRSFDQVVARAVSGAMGEGRRRDQRIRREGYDPQEVVRAAHAKRMNK